MRYILVLAALLVSSEAFILVKKKHHPKTKALVQNYHPDAAWGRDKDWDEENIPDCGNIDGNSQRPWPYNGANCINTKVFPFLA